MRHRTAKLDRLALRMLTAMLGTSLLLPVSFSWSQEQPKESVKEAEEAKTPRMTCGSCAAGYATTGRTTDEKICKEDDHALVECIPIGSRSQMSVCGSCPDGYVEIGQSSLPALCGNVEGGLRTQCQLPKIEGGMPDPTQGGRRCPPDCAGDMPTGVPPEAIPRPGKVPAVKDKE
jgi:hypothetical protein